MYAKKKASKPEAALIAELAAIVAKAHLAGQDCPLQTQALELAYSEYNAKYASMDQHAA